MHTLDCVYSTHYFQCFDMCIQEHDELEEVATGQQPQKEKEKAGLLSKALRAPLGTRTLSLHNLLDQAPLIEGQQASIGPNCQETFNLSRPHTLTLCSEGNIYCMQA